MIIVDIALAVLCVMSECFPVLIGPETPTGTYTINLRLTESDGYGGDVLQFDENDTTVFAIHRVWTLRPEERRLERLESSDPNDRIVTRGCINVSNQLYETLKSCCQGKKIIIK